MLAAVFLAASTIITGPSACSELAVFARPAEAYAKPGAGQRLPIGDLRIHVTAEIKVPGGWQATGVRGELRLFSSNNANMPGPEPVTVGMLSLDCNDSGQIEEPLLGAWVLQWDGDRYSNLGNQPTLHVMLYGRRVVVLSALLEDGERVSTLRWTGDLIAPQLGAD